jgi:hypothetical protein
LLGLLAGGVAAAPTAAGATEDRNRGASKKKEKENTHEKKNLAKSDRPTFPFFFFLGAPFKRYARRMWTCHRRPQMGTRSWLRGLPLQASSLW